MLTKEDFQWSQKDVNVGAQRASSVDGNCGEYNIELRPVQGPEGRVLVTVFRGMGDVLGVRSAVDVPAAVDFALSRVNCHIAKAKTSVPRLHTSEDRVLTLIRQHLGLANEESVAAAVVGLPTSAPLSRAQFRWQTESPVHDGVLVRRVVGSHDVYKILLTPMAGERISAAAMRGDHALGLKYTTDPEIAVSYTLERINEDIGAGLRLEADRSREVLAELRRFVGIGSCRTEEMGYVAVSNGGLPIAVADPEFFAKDVAEKVAEYSDGVLQNPLEALAGVRSRCTEMAFDLHRIHQIVAAFQMAKTVQERNSQRKIAAWVLGDCYRLAAENEALCRILRDCQRQALFERQVASACLSDAQVAAQTALRYRDFAIALWTRDTIQRDGIGSVS